MMKYICIEVKKTLGVQKTPCVRRKLFHILKKLNKHTAEVEKNAVLKSRDLFLKIDLQETDRPNLSGSL